MIKNKNDIKEEIKEKVDKNLHYAFIGGGGGGKRE
jgi:hypothetical protein